MATLRGPAISLAGPVPFGSTGQPDMSPSCCVLDDGTALVSATIDTAGSGTSEIVRVWRLAANGTVMATYDTVGSDIFVESALAATVDNQALLIISSSAGGNAYVTTVRRLDCSGPDISPVFPDGDAGWGQRFTNTDGGRWSYLMPSKASVWVGGYNGIAVYDVATGNQMDKVEYTSGMGVFGWWPHPTDPTKIAVAQRVSGGREVREYEFAGLIGTALSWPWFENYWKFVQGSPYTGGQAPTLEATDSNGWYATDKGGNAYGYPGPGYYINVSGTMYPMGDQKFLVVYEYDGGTEQRWHPALADYDLDAATRTEDVLDWPNPGDVSLSYGSFTLDVRNGTAVLAGNSTSTYYSTTTGYSVTAWLFDVAGSASKASPLAVLLDLDHTWRHVGQDQPDPGQTEGRLRLKMPDGWHSELHTGESAEVEYPLKMKTEDGSWVQVARMGPLPE